ncbi:beta,beta-carotene 9',10'-oxygenase, partial [Elysia marginata]
SNLQCVFVVSRFFSRVIPTPPNISEKTNINVLEFGDKLFAVADTPLIHEIKPDSMFVKSKTIMSDFVSIHLGSAHPHRQKDGSMIYYGTNMNPMKSYNFIHIPPPDASAKSERAFFGYCLFVLTGDYFFLNILQGRDLCFFV